jgi:hypothetical protein
LARRGARFWRGSGIIPGRWAVAQRSAVVRGMLGGGILSSMSLPALPTVEGLFTFNAVVPTGVSKADASTWFNTPRVRTRTGRAFRHSA